MTPTEAAALLTCAAAFDNRKPDADTAMAWSLALEGLRFVDCREAIVTHYRTTSEWLMPQHVIAGVTKLRTKRLTSAPPSTPPPGMDADDVAGYLAWLATERQSVADGNPPSEPPALPKRDLSELKALVRRVPPVQAAAKERDPDYAAKRAEADAGLESRRQQLAAEQAVETEPPSEPNPTTADLEVSHG